MELRLSDILGREVSIEWLEAVALVRACSDRVRDSRRPGASPNCIRSSSQPTAGRLVTRRQ